MQRLDKYTLQTLGFALIVLGIFLFMLGLVGGPDQILTGQPLPWWRWVPGASFFSGIALVIVGIILLMLARDMKPQREADVSIKKVPS